MIKKLFCLVLCVWSVVYAEVETRGAFDIGSGETKLTVADVDTEQNKIVKIWYQNFKIIELRKDVSNSVDGTLSKEISDTLVNGVMEMQADVQDLHVTKWYGVGTSIFRTASNGPALLERLKNEADAEIVLVPQSVEGEIGFNAAVAMSGLNAEDVISWDSGAGSFQISTLIDGKLQMYGEEIAHVFAFESVFKNRGEIFDPTKSPNPVSFDEVQAVVAMIQKRLPPIPDWITTKKIAAIGGKTCIFAKGMFVLGNQTYSKESIYQALQNLAGKTDEELSIYPHAHKTMVDLILLYAVMDHCHMNEITYYHTNGGCEGVLIIPRFWN